MNYALTKEWKEMISKRNDSELNNFIDSYESLIDMLKIRIRYIEDELVNRSSRREDETSGINNNTSNSSL